MMAIMKHVFCARQGCSGPGPCTEMRGNESRADRDSVSREACLEEVEPELSLKELLCCGRFRAESECMLRWQ